MNTVTTEVRWFDCVTCKYHDSCEFKSIASDLIVELNHIYDKYKNTNAPFITSSICKNYERGRY